MLSFKNITHYFAEKRVLDSVCLDISPGQINVLIGPSGCGKSTLLRLAMGLIRPREGVVEFEGFPLNHITIQNARRKMGYVIQDGGLFPHLSARENIVLLPEYLQWSRGKIEERLEVLTTLTHFPVEGLMRFPHELSGGQKQRVSLMRALMIDPEILMLDEALGALDPIVRSELQYDLKAIFNELKKTVIWVTHDMGEAAFMGERIILMKDGRIIQVDSLKNMIHKPADPFVVKFINAQRSPLSEFTEN